MIIMIIEEEKEVVVGYPPGVLERANLVGIERDKISRSILMISLTRHRSPDSHEQRQGEDEEGSKEAHVSSFFPLLSLLLLLLSVLLLLLLLLLLGLDL